MTASPVAVAVAGSACSAPAVLVLHASVTIWMSRPVQEHGCCPADTVPTAVTATTAAAATAATAAAVAAVAVKTAEDCSSCKGILRA